MVELKSKHINMNENDMTNYLDGTYLADSSHHLPYLFGIDVCPFAPSLRVAGSPHQVLSTQIFLGDLSASVGILGRPNSRSPAAGASPGTALNRGSPLRPQRPPGLS